MRFVFRVSIIIAMFAIALLDHTAASATPAKRPARPNAVTARLSLPIRSVPAGSSIGGTVVVENKTGHPFTFVGCGAVFEAALTKTGLPQDADVPGLLCRMTFAIPTGVSRYRVTLTATYASCSPTPPPGGRACLANGKAPPLRPGRYYATVAPNGSGVPTPRSVAVRVNPAKP
jgi:hypothetical protein